ncbi:MAG: DnaJ domain-containing protein [Alphaproteobacteria bacterium]|nr:DnaJ domain-containing protein [Alphaproteobacteria bacterium]
MSGAFHYRPKFVDIRVNKPAPEDRPRAAGEHPCDHMGCQRAGRHRAPKARDAEDFWWFCTQHASEYNRRWNYFADMDDTEFETFQKAAEYGHRPTWSFRASKTDRLSAAMRSFQAGRREDPYGLFGGRRAAEAPRARRLSRTQALALEALDLEEHADGAAVRARYAELVKKYHPDSNAGDRSTEALLEKVIRAYQTLKAGGLA